MVRPAFKKIGAFCCGCSIWTIGSMGCRGRGEHWIEWWWVYLAIGEFNDNWLGKKSSTKSVYRS